MKRPDPDQLLRQVQAEETKERRGRLKVFLGYYSGVGKSFRMLDEGRRRKERGQDVVIGAIQSKVAPEVEPLLKCIPVIPEKQTPNGPKMDLDAILKRHPGVCLIDGLAYDNPPGSKHAHRWEDVEELLDKGISVITTINLQYIEELRERVQPLTGKRVDQTVPERFILSADEVVVVDAPTDLDSLPASEDKADLHQKLSELREIALVLAADAVDRQLQQHMDIAGDPLAYGAQERILICLTPRANAEHMIASGRRNADRFHGELYAVYVNQPEITPEDSAALEHNLDMARKAGAKVLLLDSGDPADAIMRFARKHGITQIFLGHTKRRGMLGRVARGPVDRLLDQATEIDVRVFPN